MTDTGPLGEYTPPPAIPLGDRAAAAISLVRPDLSDTDPEAFRREVEAAGWILSVLEGE